MSGCEKRLNVWVANGGIRSDPMRMPLGRHDLEAASDSLFEDGTGLVLEPVGGEFQPSFATAHRGEGAHLFTVLHYIFVLNNKHVLTHLIKSRAICATRREAPGPPNSCPAVSRSFFS